MPSVAGFFLSRHLMWRCLWRHLDQVEMIEVLVESALDSPGLFEGPFEEVFENLLEYISFLDFMHEVAERAKK